MESYWPSTHAVSALYPAYFTALANDRCYRSLAEVCIGVITACMPSLSRMLHHHLPPWISLKSRMSSRFNTFTRLISRGKGFMSHSEAGAKTSQLGSEEKMPGGDEESHLVHLKRTPVSIDSTDLGLDYELDPRETVKTYIQSGPQRAVNEDGIYLTQELQQHSAPKNPAPTKGRPRRQP